MTNNTEHNCLTGYSLCFFQFFSFYFSFSVLCSCALGACYFLLFITLSFLKHNEMLIEEKHQHEAWVVCFVLLLKKLIIHDKCSLLSAEIPSEVFLE